MKVLVIGLDGACMDLIKPWVKDGKLPTFKKLMTEGSYGNLESIIPPLTIPAWNCFASGKNPGKFGCFSFVQKVPKSYDFQICKSTHKKEKDIWDILSDENKKVFVLNAPNVISAYKINGHMVAGFLNVLEKNLTYPKNLKKLLYEMNYERGTGYLVPFFTTSDSDFSNLLKKFTDSIQKILFHFLENEWDFGFVVFQELDGAQHKFWERKNVLLDHYQNIDETLNKILNKLDEEDEDISIIIGSDHGFRANKRMFLINEWLANNGLLKIRKKPSFLIINFLIRIIKVQNIILILKLLMKIPYLLPIYEKMIRQAAGTPIIWNETKAFSYGNWGTIYINLEGREPQGIVKKEDYEKLRTEIIEGLKKISVNAYRREELYHGKYLDNSPDIIIQIDDYVNSVSGKVGYKKEFMKGFPFEGHHDRDNGIFFGWGADIKKNFENDAKICDIVPTILHILKHPIPKDMDGRVLNEIFNNDSNLSHKDIIYHDIYNKMDMKESIKKKIGKLKTLEKI